MILLNNRESKTITGFCSLYWICRPVLIGKKKKMNITIISHGETQMRICAVVVPDLQDACYVFDIPLMP